MLNSKVAKEILSNLSVENKNLDEISMDLYNQILEKVDECGLSGIEEVSAIDKLSNVLLGQHRIARFERVSNFSEDVALPKRATKGSAGYDFFAPIDINLKPRESIVVKTGIRCNMLPGWVLKIYPRSGLGFNYHVGIANTVGIIDSDYYYSDNEGHIKVKLVNNGDKELFISKGEGFCQGIFSEYGLTIDDCVSAARNGGFGSTT